MSLYNPDPLFIIIFCFFYNFELATCSSLFSRCKGTAKKAICCYPDCLHSFKFCRKRYFGGRKPLPMAY